MSPTQLAPQRTNIILYCPAWAEVVRFYRDILGLPLAWQNEWLVEFQLTPTSFVSVADVTRTQQKPTQGVTLTWQVADVAHWWAVWQARGAEPTAVQVKWEARLFYLFDPAGNRLELWEELAIDDASN